MGAVRVLIADSDQCLLASYRETLLHSGFEVATAADGLVCLDRLRQFRPDVLVLEPSLPWGGGDGVLTLMHEEADLPLVPVIILTSGGDRGLLYRLARFHVEGYHVKPLEGKALLERIQAIAQEQYAGQKSA